MNKSMRTYIQILRTHIKSQAWLCTFIEGMERVRSLGVIDCQGRRKAMDFVSSERLIQVDKAE